MTESMKAEPTFEEKLSALVRGMCLAGLVGCGVYCIWAVWLILKVTGNLTGLPAWMNPSTEIAWAFVAFAKLVLFFFWLVVLGLYLSLRRIRSK